MLVIFLLLRLSQFLLCVVTRSFASEAETLPNVDLIFGDDPGYDLWCYNATKVRVTNIDKMAAEGHRFTGAYSLSAICMPSRCALLIGHYPVRSLGRPAPLADVCPLAW